MDNERMVEMHGNVMKSDFHFRIATEEDIAQMQIVRHLVRENVLSDPALVTDLDVADFILVRGRGWVCEQADTILGFAIVDLQAHNIWALFLRPEWEGRGIGQALMGKMLDWYFGQTQAPIWLGTAPGTRAERFYLQNGWEIVGQHGKGETKFEMQYESWCKLNAIP
jgi:GNAT superfamily N-acetyltransferase